MIFACLEVMHKCEIMQTNTGAGNGLSHHSGWPENGLQIDVNWSLFSLQWFICNCHYIVTHSMHVCCLNFTALHGMQTRSYVEISVRPSVCQTRALWQNGRKICLDFYIIRKNIYCTFLRRRMVGGGDPFYLKFWVNRPALERNRRFWTDNRS